MPRRETPHPFYEAIGKRLRERREKRRLSLDDIEAHTGVPKGHLSNIERGLVCLRIETLLLLSRALGLSMNVLTKDLEVKPKNDESNALWTQATPGPPSPENPAKPRVKRASEPGGG